MSSRISLGRNDSTRQGYIFSDLTSTLKLTDWWTFNISPKYLFSGIDNLGSVGLSSNIKFLNNLNFISETNIGVNPSNKERCLMPKKIELKEKIAVAIPVIHALDEDLFCLARSVSILRSVPVIWGEAIELGLHSKNRNQN